MKTRLEFLSLLSPVEGTAGWGTHNSWNRTEKMMVYKTKSGNNRSELTGTEIFSFHDHTGIPQKWSRKESYLKVGRQGTGTLFLNGLSKAWLTRITWAFLNYPFSSTRECEESNRDWPDCFLLTLRQTVWTGRGSELEKKLFTLLRFITLRIMYPKVA